MIKISKIKPQTDPSPPCSFNYLSLMRYTSECECVEMRRASLLFIFFRSLDFPLNKSAPLKLTGPTSLGGIKQLSIILMRVLMTRLTMEGFSS